MTLSPGQDVLLLMGDGQGGYDAIAGLRSRRFVLQSSTADASRLDTGAWRHLLPGGGLRQASISGSGLFVNDAAISRARAAFFSETYTDWRIEIPNSGAIEGAFHLTSLEINGISDAEAGMSIALVSSGTLIFEEPLS